MNRVRNCGGGVDLHLAAFADLPRLTRLLSLFRLGSHRRARGAQHRRVVQRSPGLVSVDFMGAAVRQPGAAGLRPARWSRAANRRSARASPTCWPLKRPPNSLPPGSTATSATRCTARCCWRGACSLRRRGGRGCCWPPRRPRRWFSPRERTRPSAPASLVSRMWSK